MLARSVTTRASASPWAASVQTAQRKRRAAMADAAAPESEPAAAPAAVDASAAASNARPSTSESGPVTAPNTPGPSSPAGKMGRAGASPGRGARVGSPGLSTPYGRPMSRGRSPRAGSPRGGASPNRYLQAHNERKMVETDVQLMANRLARLKAEEVKAMKKVDTMRRKADEIVAQKQRNLQKYQMKYQHVAAEYEALQQQAAQQAYLRSQHKENLRLSKEMVAREKRDNAVAIKQATKENEWLAAKFKQEEVARNRMSRDFIRSRQREFTTRKQQYKEFLAKHLDEETEMRISEEQQALSENIRGIEKMSEDEKMLLERLKALNSAHQEASNELAMALSHDPFAEAESVAGAGADAAKA